MRNLRNVKHRSLRFDAGHPALTDTAWDLDDLICAFGPSEGNSAITLKRIPGNATHANQAETVASWDAPCPNPDLSFDRIVCLHCVDGSISLVLEGGDIVVVRPDAGSEQDLIEIVGSVDAGIFAAAWSPDQELLAIVTKANTLLLMTRDFEGTANVTISAEDVHVSNHVSVGWGKKETQFKGRGVAKALRDPTVPEHVDEGTLSPFEDGQASISWRGDGQYLAINSVVDGQYRAIRVYNRDGVLDSISEPVNGLHSALSWKPSGQTLAAVQVTHDLTQVIFFERNGLRHGEFDLTLSDAERNDFGGQFSLSWNVDSTVLAVTMKDRVQLWTTSNYHWYLKQEIALSSSINIPNISYATWHPEKPLHLACASSNGSVRLLQYTSVLSRGSLRSPHDVGLVAVIDGKSLKVTPLRTANIPPPMALDEMELPSIAVDVSYSPEKKQIAVLHGHSVTVWVYDYAAKPFERATLLRTIDLIGVGDDKLSAGLQARQICHSPGTAEWTILCAAENAEGVLRSTAGLSAEDLSVFSQSPISSCASGLDHDCIFIQDEKGQISRVRNDILFPIATLPMPCPVFDVWQGPDDTSTVFGLSQNGVLHVVSSTFASFRIPGCTSFLITTSHLIYTTSQHLLKFVHLQNETELQIPLDEPEKDERCRAVERGAKIVTVVPSAFSLILQMPRGNLETIYPRALVLAGIRQSILSRNYKRAFLTCRTHRVDMNILHDYAPESFMRDVALFVKQVKRTEYLDLFLSSLSEENVAETLYKETLTSTLDRSEINGNPNGVDAKDSSKSSVTMTVSKVNAICDEFLRVLQDQPSNRLQNIVTTYVCKSPPDLEAGLRLVSDLRQKDSQQDLEQAVEHICFLADVNQLYDTALGIYDLDVALLVAQQSQKDPREYMPYLQRLQEMDPLRRRFSIDDDLKRYKKALAHLHALGVFDEIKEYTSQHELYSAAMELYRYDNARLTELMRLHAGYLSSRNRYKESGIAYEFVQDYGSACEAYRAAGMWQECLAAAALASVGNNELVALATDLSSSLEESKDLDAAATVHLEYLDDLEAAIRLLCRGYHFAKAIRISAKCHRRELLSSLIDPGLIEGSATITELLAEMKMQLNAQVPRLREVRQKKVDDPMAFLEGGGDGDEVDIPDNLSIAPTDASTTGTFMTRYTNRSTGTLATNATRKTSKNRRREERKRAKGKKGTVYEEEYLVNSVARLIERLNSVMDDVKKLVEGLMRRTMRERAVAVESAMQDVVSACRSCMAEVFDDQESKAAPLEMPDEAAAARPVGGQGVLWEALTRSGQKPLAPTLRTFESFLLL